jgi:serine protease inhibitor
MMHEAASVGYLQGTNFQALRLQYGQGRMSMLIVLPDPSISLGSFVSDISADTLNGWVAQASFPGIGQACISDVEHKTVVEVDETGTVAAGATTITVGPTAVSAPMFTITLNHPFHYAIRDDQTGELLFIGTLMNPS